MNRRPKKLLEQVRDSILTNMHGGASLAPHSLMSARNRRPPLSPPPAGHLHPQAHYHLINLVLQVGTWSTSSACIPFLCGLRGGNIGKCA
jgi:hypothetical protein